LDSQGVFKELASFFIKISLSVTKLRSNFASSTSKL